MTSVPLTQAVSSGDAAAVKASLASGADVNERTGGGQTPLILATIFGHTHLIPILLKAGANPHLQDNLGLNAIDWAQRRGLSEASEILTQTPNTSAPSRSTIPTPVAAPPAEPQTRTLDPHERSRRWLAGVKQRIAEQGGPRDTLEGSNIFRQQPEPPEPPEPPQPTEPPVAVPIKSTAPAPVIEGRSPKTKVHIEIDEPPIISEPLKGSPGMFWSLIAITLIGSIIGATLITTYLYSANRAAPVAATPAPSSRQQGTPVVGSEFVGRVVSLPEAQYQLNGQEPLEATVVVRITVDKSGRVTAAEASGGDKRLRDAATAAALKSSFTPERLRGQEVQGTISYTFR